MCVYVQVYEHDNGAANFKLKLYFCIPLKPVGCKFSFDTYSEVDFTC